MKKKRLRKPDRVEVKPSSYQPTKAEKEQRWRIDATPEQVAEKLLRPVKFEPKDDASS